MAFRTTVALVDDLDGSEAEESVSFGVEGIDYEIDLSDGHAQALRKVLAPYAAAARRTRPPFGIRPLGDTARTGPGCELWPVALRERRNPGLGG